MAETWDELARKLQDSFEKLRQSKLSGKSTIEPFLFEHLDSAVQNLCNTIKARYDNGTQMIPS